MRGKVAAYRCQPASYSRLIASKPRASEERAAVAACAALWPNPSASVHSYPVVERYRFVWVWPGDPAAADPALVPDMHENDDPNWAGDGKTITAACDYRLIVDNLIANPPPPAR